MIGAGGKRDSRVVAFGGGSVGDLAGFVAGCFMRGLEFSLLPTTLLAQVDAAVGGKTAINLPHAKNSIGLFHHPRLVVSDTGLLATLASQEVRSGLVEVLKMAILSDPELFSDLERNLESLLGGASASLAGTVAAAARAKIDIVERDPTEKRERMLLNLGHTLGHALEAALDYRSLRHGEAVGYGILFAVRLAERRGLPTATADRIRRLIERFELPRLPALDPEVVAGLIGHDKKGLEGGWRWVLPLDLGDCEIVSDLGETTVEQELKAFLRSASQSS
jgi:3-dehydroquinate synthase